jgi:hypothetical protein
MKDIKALKELAIHAIRGTTPAPTAEFSCTVEEVESTLREELNALAGDYNSYRRNKYDIFEIMQEAADEYLPNKVIAAMGAFADVRTFRDGEKVEFKVKKGKLRGKKFVTAASPAGVYESFRLDSDVITVNTKSVGGATTIDFNRYLCGDEDMAENMAVLYEGIEDAIYGMVQEALIATIEGKATGSFANYAIVDGFEADSMVGLINTVKADGTGAVIYATREFIADMGADVIATGNCPAVSTKDIDAIHDTGLVQVFRGCPIVELPQSFVDENNEAKVINPAYAYVFPTGGEKVVKIAFEGNTVVDEWKNRDRSWELEAYKKVGVAILHTNNWAIYHNTALD